MLGISLPIRAVKAEFIMEVFLVEVATMARGGEISPLVGVLLVVLKVLEGMVSIEEELFVDTTTS